MEYSLITFCDDILHYIIRIFDVKSMIYVARCCKKFYVIYQDINLWWYYINRDFLLYYNKYNIKINETTIGDGKIYELIETSPYNHNKSFCVKYSNEYKIDVTQYDVIKNKTKLTYIDLSNLCGLYLEDSETLLFCEYIFMRGRHIGNTCNKYTLFNNNYCYLHSRMKKYGRLK